MTGTDLDPLDLEHVLARTGLATAPFLGREGRHFIPLPIWLRRLGVLGSAGFDSGNGLLEEMRFEIETDRPPSRLSGVGVWEGPFVDGHLIVRATAFDVGVWRFAMEAVKIIEWEGRVWNRVG